MEQRKEACAALEQAAALCRAYGLPDAALAADARQMEEYRAVAAVLGAFNTGKSTLVNAVLETQLLQVSLTEETAVPVCVGYGHTGVQLLRDGRWQAADAAALRAGGRALEDARMARAMLPLPALQGLEGIALADTPGIGTAHAAQSAALARGAAAYILVFGADAPVLTESLAAVLASLPLAGRPVLCVLTKCDQFSSGQLKSIAAYLEDSLARQLGLRARLCRLPGRQGMGEVRRFLGRLQVRAGALLRAEAARRLAADAQPLARYLDERIRSAGLLEPELARKAQLLDGQIGALQTTVDAMNARAGRLLDDAAAAAAARSGATLAPLAGPLADLLAAGQDPVPCADGALLGVVRAEGRSRLAPILDAYEKGLRRLASMYGMQLPECPSGWTAEAVEQAFTGTGEALARCARDSQSLCAALQALVGECLARAGSRALERLREALARPLYSQLDSLGKALADARRQHTQEEAARRRTLDALRRDSARLARLLDAAKEVPADAI